MKAFWKLDPNHLSYTYYYIYIVEGIKESDANLAIYQSIRKIKESKGNREQDWQQVVNACKVWYLPQWKEN